MEREVFAQRFQEASARARDFSREFIEEPLPEPMLFRLRLNASYDGNPLHEDEHVFPEDTGSELAQRLSRCTSARIPTRSFRSSRRSRSRAAIFVGMKRDPEPLRPPPIVDEAEWAVELVRLWAADGKLHVSMRWDYFKHAGHWGIALVDFSRHIARAWAEGADRDPGVVMHEIRDAFDAEWDEPTDLGSGSLRG